jgi:F0F1-type ATP synthase membrane subunit a
MKIPSLGVIWSTFTATVTVASFVCNILPKSTVFAGYPRVKKAYETGINFIIALALNVRTCMPSLNIHLPGLGFDKPQDQGNNAPTPATPPQGPNA